MAFSVDLLKDIVSNYPKAPGDAFSYGTSGFRLNANKMKPVFSRISVLAVLRALKMRKIVGLMTTASHNPVWDNGIKMIDPYGGMLDMDWEDYATSIVNAENEHVLMDIVQNIVTKERISFDGSKLETELDRGIIGVFLGRDTRPHSKELSGISLSFIEALIKSLGSKFANFRVVDIGVVSTPQLHYVVKLFNENLPVRESLMMSKSELWRDSLLNTYQQNLAMAFTSILENSMVDIPFEMSLEVDAGYGVGGPQFQKLCLSINEAMKASHYPVASKGKLAAHVFNLATADDMCDPILALNLNNGCGAEYVQKERCLPINITKPLDIKKHYVSFDGDADRIVYFSASETNDGLILFDGDKIACLLARYILEHMANLPASIASEYKREISFCVVQTAYANGASSLYINNGLRKEFSQRLLEGSALKVAFSSKLVRTGVKYLHHEAIRHDIAVYFEANGHGTVLFAPSFISALEKHESHSACKGLLAFQRLINQAAGDAMSDTLAIEVCLFVSNISIKQWAALYTDLPSCMTKLKVEDRTVIKTNDNETKIISHVDLQEEINKLVEATNVASNSTVSRCFVRPSGTEDIVRVYAEASSQGFANELNEKVQQAVIRFLSKS